MAVEVEERNLRILSWFVVRARRVEEHSLLADTTKLVTWASGTMRLTQVENEPTATLTWDLPPEEGLDSLAARCRPFILAGDTVYWSTVTGAIGYYLRDPADPMAIGLKHIRAAWAKLDKSASGPLAFESRAGDVADGLGEIVTDKELAYAWLYGDLVHADNLPERVGAHGLNDRYRAGAILISNVAVNVIATLNLVRQLRDQGALELPDEPFTRAVRADPDSPLAVAALAQLPVGATSADLEAALDAQQSYPSPTTPPASSV